ncbi:MAG: NifB/NifX family molybdenum-iron cluster-binding protein [Bacilli bacterium]|nr:NifB/NifX family molybdenum-iron cluster-binding protein [Bacilli bacterium]
MKIAITYDPIEKEVFQHFGHCESFLVYDKESGESSVIDNGGNSHIELISYLQEQGVEVLICGGIGGRAIELLSAYGIEVVPGATGDAFAALGAYLKGELKSNDGAIHQCSHEGGHEHHHGDHDHCDHHDN